MRKVLAILLVALLSVSAVFAAVSFSGSITAGYVFNYFDDYSKDLVTHLYGDDGDNTNTGSLNLKIADDDGYWNATVEGTLETDSSGAMAVDIEIDFAKLIFGADSEWSITAGMAANDRAVGLRAYSNQSGQHFDRVRSADGGYFATLGVGYSDIVKVQAAIAPKLKEVAMAFDSEEITDTLVYRGDIVLSALATPINGLAVSVDWALNGENKNDDGTFGAAANVDLGSMLDMDFSIGLSVADRWKFDIENTLAATVYGGIDIVDVAIEYAYTNSLVKGDDSDLHYLWAGVNLNIVEDLGITIYTGASSLEHYKDTYFVGTELSYTLKGIIFGLGIEYAEGKSFNYDVPGLNIVPSVSVSW